MKALVYHGSKDVRVESVADPGLEEADDILLRVTATAICGSDLHIFRGKIPKMEAGDILGHEFMGVVEEAGPEVTAVKRGRSRRGSVRDCLRPLLLLRSRRVRVLRNDESGPRRDPQREGHQPPGGTVRLQPSIRRPARRAG